MLAAGEAQAARPALAVGVFVSTRTDLCYDPGDVAAIRKLIALEQERINRQGGVHGRPIQLRVLDDQADPKQTIANVRSALADPQMLAMIGITNSNRAKAVFDMLGKDIGASGIPFVSDVSVNSLFASYANVYTTRASQEEERVPVLAQFMKQMSFERPAFVGLKDNVFSAALGDGLKAAVGERLAGDYRLTVKDEKLDSGAVSAMIGELKSKSPDVLVLNVGLARAGGVMRQLTGQGLVPPIMIMGRIDAIPPEVVREYRNDIYQLAWDSLPDVYNDRLRRIISRASPLEWVFEGRKVPQAPGWANGECKPRPEIEKPDPLEAANLRAIGMGAQFADMVGLVAAAAKAADPNADLKALRSSILAELATSYVAGRGAYKGSFDNWSFQRASRSAARTPFIIMRPHGLGRSQLAPMQFARLKGDKLRRINTLYADIDLIRAYRVDDNEKTFFAEFYLSLHDNKETSLEHIEFTNAFLDPKTNDRQITIRTLHGGGPSEVYPDSMRVYQISGRFIFEPQLTSYPFDTQRFSIDIQPKRGDAPFIVQPPPVSLRDKSVGTDGWEPKEQYVGYDADFVPVIDAFTHEPSIAPFYKASFVWMMKRETTDYFLRVMVPLGFILVVAYLSIFIPASHFEAIITLQVTALLSAVALYLSLPKLDAGTATLSDRLFIFNYMLVSLMIGVSILRASRLAMHRNWLKAVLAIVHIVAVPVAVALIAMLVYDASMSG